MMLGGYSAVKALTGQHDLKLAMPTGPVLAVLMLASGVYNVILAKPKVRLAPRASAWRCTQS